MDDWEWKEGFLALSREYGTMPDQKAGLVDLYRFEQERRNSMEVERLFELVRHDSTVVAFINAWRRGDFRSFEAMVCELAVQLAAEKAQCMQVAIEAIRRAPPGLFNPKD